MERCYPNKVSRQKSKPKECKDQWNAVEILPPTLVTSGDSKRANPQVVARRDRENKEFTDILSLCWAMAAIHGQPSNIVCEKNEQKTHKSK